MADIAPPLRVVIYEQEYLLGLDLAQQLEESGVNVVAMRNDLGAMIDEFRDGGLGCDAAILDINSNDQRFADLLRQLEQAEVAVLLVGTSTEAGLPVELQVYPYISKPIAFEHVIAALRHRITGWSDRDID